LMQPHVSTSSSAAVSRELDPGHLRTMQQVITTLEEKRAGQIMVLDVRGLSSLTEYLVIAEGNVEKHVQALGRQIIDLADEHQLELLYHEGLPEGCWALFDLGEVMIHIMVPQWRSFYSLERMWPAAKIVPLDQIRVSQGMHQQSGAEGKVVPISHKQTG
jgi:ribosome-associated protein